MQTNTDKIIKMIQERIEYHTRERENYREIMCEHNSQVQELNVLKDKISRINKSDTDSVSNKLGEQKLSNFFSEQVGSNEPVYPTGRYS